jgi:hypothetical protein
VVGDVVTKIGHRRTKERRQPDGVDAQPRQVVEATTDTFEVSDAVTVGVLERTRIDLVDDGGLPPRLVMDLPREHDPAR